MYIYIYIYKKHLPKIDGTRYAETWTHIWNKLVVVHRIYIIKTHAWRRYNSALKGYGLLSDRYTFCQKCFNDIPGDTVTLGDDPTQPQT